MAQASQIDTHKIAGKNYSSELKRQPAFSPILALNLSYFSTGSIRTSQLPSTYISAALLLKPQGIYSNKMSQLPTNLCCMFILIKPQGVYSNKMPGCL